MSTTATSPVEHDTRLLELLRAVATAGAALDAATDALFRSASTRTVTHTYEASWAEGSMPRRCKADELEAGLVVDQRKTFNRGEEGYYVTGEPGAYVRNRRPAKLADALAAAAPEAIAKREAAQAALTAAVEAIRAHEEAYTGWNRYFLVTSSAGHVHRSMHCSTCNPRTTYAPVVALSGQTDTEAVELLGETLCTVCFPEAPVTGKPDKITAAKARKLVEG